ncbi:ABC transporter permease subunit [Thermococcus sp. 9N3]|uniref:ABC transporter permease n=1 Tax=Thermococcus sp. 9N3 TaxID=163002 RepID=UPI0014307D88|nr:ABC transporter permease subunit [Thermococcus sp. 9N3]NJE49511.1 ABC transporter permease [Thermococcus sp. 9N3]
MIGAIAEKEFRDYLTSRRFLIIFGFLLTTLVLSLLQTKLGIESWGSPGSEMPKVYDIMWGLSFYLGFIGAIFALSLGFDAITREYEERTLKVLMGHPVFRDQVILGKFLGGAMAIGLAVTVTALISTGMLLWIGITIDDYTRLVTYFLLVYIYLMVFFTMAVAFSAHSKNSGNALMYSLVVFLALMTILTPLGSIIAHELAGPQPKMSDELKALQEKMSMGNATMEDYNKYRILMEEYHNETEKWYKKYSEINDYFQALSPEYEFTKISQYVLNPYVGSDSSTVVYYPDHNEEQKKYSLLKSISFVKKELIALLAYLLVWFVVAYLGFVRAEIR